MVVFAAVAFLGGCLLNPTSATAAVPNSSLSACLLLFPSHPSLTHRHATHANPQTHIATAADSMPVCCASSVCATITQGVGRVTKHEHTPNNASVGVCCAVLCVYGGCSMCDITATQPAILQLNRCSLFAALLPLFFHAGGTCWYGGGGQWNVMSIQACCCTSTQAATNKAVGIAKVRKYFFQCISHLRMCVCVSRPRLGLWKTAHAAALQRDHLGAQAPAATHARSKCCRSLAVSTTTYSSLFA